MSPDDLKFSREWYDFSDVPEAELESCMYYEYMRESESVWKACKAVVLRWAKVKPPKGGGEKPFTIRINKLSRQRGRELVAAMMLGTMHGYGIFVPWQKLSKEKKERVLGFPAAARKLIAEAYEEGNPVLVVETCGKDPLLETRTLGAWKESRIAQGYRLAAKKDWNKKVHFGFVQMDLRYSRERLVGAFRQWLEANHPECNEVAKETRGRNAERDALNALGALRLRYYCATLRQAQQLIAPLEAKPTGMHYSDRTSWKRACDAAVKHFDRLLLPRNGELPMHYTKGWRKKTRQAGTKAESPSRTGLSETLKR